MLKKEDFIGKIFADAAPFIAPNTRVAIGGENSFGFFYFGTAKTMIEDIYKLRNENLTKIEKLLNSDKIEPLRRMMLNKELIKTEDFDLLNAKVIDIFNKTQDADIGIILSDYLLPCFWFIEEFEKKTRFAGHCNSIEEVYKRFPDLIGAFDPIILGI